MKESFVGRGWEKYRGTEREAAIMEGTRCARPLCWEFSPSSSPLFFMLMKPARVNVSILQMRKWKLGSCPRWVTLCWGWHWNSGLPDTWWVCEPRCHPSSDTCLLGAQEYTILWSSISFSVIRGSMLYLLCILWVEPRWLHPGGCSEGADSRFILIPPT